MRTMRSGKTCFLDEHMIISITFDYVKHQSLFLLEIQTSLLHLPLLHILLNEESCIKKLPWSPLTEHLLETMLRSIVFRVSEHAKQSFNHLLYEVVQRWHVGITGIREVNVSKYESLSTKLPYHFI
jgi:hypothetical protein